MKVKNVSARLHHVGSVSIAPGEVKVIPDAFATSINTAELVEQIPAPVAVAKPPVAIVKPVAPKTPAAK